MLLAGGTGGAKLARGMADVAGADALVVVANTADDCEIYGAHVSPDPDLVTFHLAVYGIDERWLGPQHRRRPPRHGRLRRRWDARCGSDVLLPDSAVGAEWSHGSNLKQSGVGTENRMIAVNLKPAVLVKVNRGVRHLLGPCLGLSKRHLARVL